jgi:hypothetical protein
MPSASASELDSYIEKCVNNALSFIKTDQEMIDYVKNFNGSKGFAFTKNPIIEKITKATNSDGHSGASFNICLRICQKILIEDANTERAQ